MKKVSILVAIILLLSLLSACASTPEPPEATVIVATQQQSEETPESYPVPQQPPANNPAYPVPEQEAVPTVVQPEITPDPSMATVEGVLLYNSKPIPGAILYLSEVVRSEDGEAGVVAFERSAPTKTFTTTEGEFVFYNIPPGEYGLVIDVIAASYLLSYPDGSEEILVTISSNESIDLGTLDFDDLPIPEP
jgi:hypothetical protein